MASRSYWHCDEDASRLDLMILIDILFSQRCGNCMCHVTRICNLNISLSDCTLAVLLKKLKGRIGENGYRHLIKSFFIHRLCLHGTRHQVIFLFSTSQRRGGLPLFLVLPFVFISGSRGTLTATCRARCGHVFLSCALSSLSSLSLPSHPVSGRHYAAYPSPRGNDARTARDA